MNSLILSNIMSIDLKINRYIIYQNMKSLCVSCVTMDSMIHQEYVDIWCQGIHMTEERSRKLRMNTRERVKKSDCPGVRECD